MGGASPPERCGLLLGLQSAGRLQPWPLYEALAAAVVASSAYEAAGGSPWLGLALADECPDGGEGGVQWWPASAARVALLLLLLPVLCFLASVAGLMLHVALKWAIVGRYSEGDYPFFGEYHVKWMVMMLLAGAAEDVIDSLGGTAWMAIYYRLMGARVGKDCCLFGLALEYDLLTLGDRVAVGWECDTTCHTVGPNGHHGLAHLGDSRGGCFRRSRTWSSSSPRPCSKRAPLSVLTRCSCRAAFSAAEPCFSTTRRCSLRAPGRRSARPKPPRWSPRSWTSCARSRDVPKSRGLGLGIRGLLAVGHDGRLDAPDAGPDLAARRRVRRNSAA